MIDYDEINNVIINAHLSERMGGKNQTFRWVFKRPGDIHIDNLLSVYSVGKNKTPEELTQAYLDFVSQPVCEHMFLEYLKTTDPVVSPAVFADFQLFTRKDNQLKFLFAKTMVEKYTKWGDSKQPTNPLYNFLTSKPDFDLISQTPATRFDESVITAMNHLKAEIETYFAHKIYPTFTESVEFTRAIQLLEYARRPVTSRNFSKIRIVGKGAFGAVYAAEKMDTHIIYAWKEMDKRKLKHEMSYDVALNELNRLLEIKSNFVTEIKYSFYTERSVVIVQDYYSGGDLKYHMRYSSGDRRKRNPYSAEVSRFFAAQILLGLEDMHRHSIIMRDLKPSNVLLDELGHCRISDLGLAKKLVPERPYSTGLSGTPGYWAPEVLCRKPYGLWVDWWSFGVTLYELLSGRRPSCACKKNSKQWCTFSDRKVSEVNALSSDGEYHQHIIFPTKYFSPLAEDLIRHLLIPEKSKRLGYSGSAEIKAHAYFKDIDWVKMRMLKVPSKFQIKKHEVNAKGVHEMGEFDSHEYRKLMFTPDDEKILSQFKYCDSKIVQNEVVQVLRDQVPKGAMFLPGEFKSGAVTATKKPFKSCCALL